MRFKIGDFIRPSWAQEGMICKITGKGRGYYRVQWQDHDIQNKRYYDYSIGDIDKDSELIKKEIKEIKQYGIAKFINSLEHK